jgi:hypothetical protein
LKSSQSDRHANIVGARSYRVGMAYMVQVTIDSTDPHALAEWWAETLGWRVEAQDETFIRQMISEGHATEADMLIHRGALVWREGAAIHPADEQLPRAPSSRWWAVHAVVRDGGDGGRVLAGGRGDRPCSTGEGKRPTARRAASPRRPAR